MLARMWRKGNPCSLLVKMQIDTATVENKMEVPLKKLKLKKKNKNKTLRLELPYDPAIPLLGIYLEKMKTQIQKDTCTPMFRAAFTPAKIWKKPKRPSTEEWIKKM